MSELDAGSRKWRLEGGWFLWCGVTRNGCLVRFLKQFLVLKPYESLWTFGPVGLLKWLVRFAGAPLLPRGKFDKGHWLKEPLLTCCIVQTLFVDGLLKTRQKVLYRLMAVISLKQGGRGI